MLLSYVTHLTLEVTVQPVVQLTNLLGGLTCLKSLQVIYLQGLRQLLGAVQISIACQSLAPRLSR